MWVKSFRKLSLVLLFAGPGLLAQPILELAAPAEYDVESLIQSEQRQLGMQRVDLLEMMTRVEDQYPRLPKGLLAAMAYVGSRWIHRVPVDEEPTHRHQHQPQTVGLMGMYRGEAGYRNVLGEAAAALGVSEASVLADPLVHLEASAALLVRYMDDAGLALPDPEDMAEVLGRFSGLPANSKIGRFARDSYVYDVLLTLDQGSDHAGMLVPERPIEWTRAFAAETLVTMRAPLVRIDPEQDSLVIPGYHLDPIDGTLEAENGESPRREKRSTDYGPALWVASPYHGTRSANPSAVTIHTTQGSYSGTLSWFQNNPFSVSAHYVIRSSDGQITQMVREYRKAHHVGVHNSYTIGIEHEGFVNTSSYYTEAMYDASAALVRDICNSHGIDPNTCYSGASSSSVQVLSTSILIKGHQHFSSQTHTDPGVFWNWPKFKNKITGSSGGGGTQTILDSFETNEGHFTNTPTYSGSTKGISSASTAARTNSIRRAGSYSEQLRLVDQAGSSSDWAVRFLSGGGSPSRNVSLVKSGGRLGFWVYSGGTGMRAALGVDDQDGTERSVEKSIPANTWTFLEWQLGESSQWRSWVGGNGRLDAGLVTLDAIWFFRDQTSYPVYLYIDDVTYQR